MKIFYKLALTLLFFVVFSSCQQELHFPELKPENKFTVIADGITYNLKVDFENIQLGDVANLKLTASSQDYVVSIISSSDTHLNGSGNYFLMCCNNDVFEYTSGTRKHWEGDHIGSSRQNGFVEITRMDEKGYAGKYSISTKDGSGRNAAHKDFTGSFEICY